MGGSKSTGVTNVGFRFSSIYININDSSNAYEHAYELCIFVSSPWIEGAIQLGFASSSTPGIKKKYNYSEIVSLLSNQFEPKNSAVTAVVGSSQHLKLSVPFIAQSKEFPGSNISQFEKKTSSNSSGFP